MVKGTEEHSPKNQLIRTHRFSHRLKWQLWTLHGFGLSLLHMFWLLDGYFCVNTKSKNGGVWYFFLLLGPFSFYWVVSFSLVRRFVPSLIVSCYIIGMPHIFWCKKEEGWIWEKREMVGKLGWVEGEKSVVQIWFMRAE